MEATVTNATFHSHNAPRRRPPATASVWRQAQYLLASAWGGLTQRRRGRALARVAARLDLHAVDSLLSLMDYWFMRFPLFQTGQSRSIRHIIAGMYRNVDVIVMDYHCKADERSVNTTVIAFRLRHNRIATFALTPTRCHDIAAAHVPGNMHPVTFQDSDTFNKAYTLRSSGPEQTHDLFHPRVQTHLVQHSDWSIQGGGDWLILYHPHCRCTASRLPDLLWEAYQTFRQFHLR